MNDKSDILGNCLRQRSKIASATQRLPSRQSKIVDPDGELLDIENDTDLALPDLPGDWSWTNVTHYHWNHKVNLFFGLDQDEVGGHLGEIDNHMQDGQELWTIHVRPIVDVPGEDRNRPRTDAETAVEHTSLDDAIEAVPDHIATYYGQRND